MTTMSASRVWNGPALFSYGFRPFFLGGAVWGALMVALWISWFTGAIMLPSALPPVVWHIHELLFGMIVAVIAGFLLTAIPNWTGRLPVAGWPLVGLFTLWAVGRVAVAVSELIGLVPALCVALLFPLAMIAFASREIIAAGNARNLVVVVFLAIFAGGEAVFALEVIVEGYPVFGHRIAIGAALMLVMLIGGRITPSFTTNWLKKQGALSLPVPFGRFDKLALLAGAVAVLAWIAEPAIGAAWIGGLFLLAAAAHVVRMARWRPFATVREPLLTVLHIGYLFIPAGFIVAGGGRLTGQPHIAQAAVHTWTIGAIGLMILAVMTRASRGHTGRALTAPPSTIILYLAVALSAIFRVLASLQPGAMQPLLSLSAGLWVIAFAGFAVLYGPMLLSGRKGD
ncbi:NnrS family protein [Acuticoccus sp. M5D2P5]|uniref:NnrS family protein n=1 Tax=Acuticoccus kalidii TaxID=2910977 RepID=UPI001F42C612|nr:NnrS family protein [Acuticoccus kalidii]MCF3933332.1 NnrS family protein [Acuticoccus kalidii]